MAKYSRPNVVGPKAAGRRQRVVIPPSFLTGFHEIVPVQGVTLLGFIAPVDGRVFNCIVHVDMLEGIGAEVVVVTSNNYASATNAWKLKKGKNNLLGEFSVEVGDRILVKVLPGTNKNGELGEMRGVWFGGVFTPDMVQRSVVEEPIDEGSTVVIG